MTSAQFPPSARLKRRADFLRVQNGGSKRHVRHFLVFTRTRADAEGEQDLPTARLGITVTRKIGNAVERNRIKRMLRDVFRRERETLPTGIDMVWVAKRQAKGVTYDEVRGDFLQFQRQLRRQQDRPQAALGPGMGENR